MHVLTVLRPRIDSSKPSGAFILIIGCQKGFVYLDESFFVSYGHEVFLRHKAPLTARGEGNRIESGKGDKNKIPVSNGVLRSADFGGRAAPSDLCAWGVFVVTKTHLAT
jgi:hypothetical protein